MILLCNRLMHTLHSVNYYVPAIKNRFTYSSTSIANGMVIYSIRFQSQSLYNIFQSANDGFMIDIEGSDNFNDHKQRILDKMKARLKNMQQ